MKPKNKTTEISRWGEIVYMSSVYLKKFMFYL